MSPTGSRNYMHTSKHAGGLKGSEGLKLLWLYWAQAPKSSILHSSMKEGDAQIRFI